MFNRIIAAVLSLSILINPCLAQEGPVDENWQISEDTMVWQPVEKTLMFGNLRLSVWLLPVDGMVSPQAGYLIQRGGVSDLLNITNSFQTRLDTVIQEERTACDTQLTECRESCKAQQRQLRTDFDSQVIQITNLNTNITTLEENVLLYKILAGVGGVAALSFGIYAVVK